MCPLVENKCFSPPPSVVSDLTLRVSQNSGYFQTLGGLGSPSAPLPVLLFPLCCRMCGLTLEEDDLEGDKGEGDGETGQVRSLAATPPLTHCHMTKGLRSINHGFMVPRRSSECHVLYRICLIVVRWRIKYPGSKFFWGILSDGALVTCSRTCRLTPRVLTQVCRRCSLPSNGGSGSPCDLASPRGSRRGRRGAKLYRCPHCPFLSHYPNHLARHAHTHSEEKPHSCPHCPYTSSHLDNLKRHLRVHTGEKPYQCPSCSYACGNLANLRRHERIHSGAKPFHCGVCGYSCNQSMNLKRHMLRHTGEKPYACAECDYTTGHWDNYKRHQRKHGHDTDSWDKHAPINGLSWSRDAQGGASEEHG